MIYQTIAAMLVIVTSPAFAGDFYSDSGSFFDRISCDENKSEEMVGITTLGVNFPNPICALDAYIQWNPEDQKKVEEQKRPFYKAVVYREKFCEDYDLSQVTFEPVLFQQACSLPSTYNTYRKLVQQLTQDETKVGIVLLEDWNPSDFVVGNFQEIFFGGFEGNQPVVVASNLLLAELSTKKALEASTKLTRAQAPTSKSVEISAANQMLDFYRYSPLLAVTHAFSQLNCENIKKSPETCFVYRDILKMALSKSLESYNYKFAETVSKFEKINDYVNSEIKGKDFSTNEKMRRVLLVKSVVDQLAKLHNLDISLLSQQNPEVIKLHNNISALNELGIDYDIEGLTSLESTEAITFRALSDLFSIEYLNKTLNAFDYHNKAFADKEFSVWKNSWQYEKFSDSFQKNLDRSMSFVTKMLNNFANINQ